jgi:hypothetical protein
MYFEYVYTVAAIVTLVKVGVLGAVIISLAKTFSKYLTIAEEEKTVRARVEAESYHCSCKCQSDELEQEDDQQARED